MTKREKEILKNLKKEEKILAKDVMSTEITLRLKRNKLNAIRESIYAIENEIEQLQKEVDINEK